MKPSCICLSLLILLILFLIPKHTFAQTCPGDLVLSRQSQVDSFKINYPGCIQFLGGLIIRSENNIDPTDIHSLDSLLGLHRVFGNMIIENNPLLKSLKGLDSLIAVGLGVSVSLNHSLKDLQGLGKLSRVNWDMNIVNNEQLESLDGLSSLDTLNQSLIINGNNSLLNIKGLASLRYLKTSLVISENNLLSNLEGLEGIQSLDVVLRVLANAELQSLKGLDNLKKAASVDVKLNGKLKSMQGMEKFEDVEFIILQFNPELESLDALAGLKNIFFRIDITDNFNLESIDGLGNANLDSLQQLNLRSNPKLEFCHTQNICNFLENSENYSIFLNGTNCVNYAAITNICKTVSTKDHHLNDGAFSIYPNPSVSDLNIMCDNEEVWKVEIRKISGELVLRDSFHMQAKIPIDHLSSGMYFISLNNSRYQKTYKWNKL